MQGTFELPSCSLSIKLACVLENFPINVPAQTGRSRWLLTLLRGYQLEDRSKLVPLLDLPQHHVALCHQNSSKPLMVLHLYTCKISLNTPNCFA